MAASNGATVSNCRSNWLMLVELLRGAAAGMAAVLQVAACTVVFVQLHKTLHLMCY